MVIRRGGVGGHGLHHRQHEIEEGAGIEQMRGGVADAAARVAGPFEESAHQPREEAFRPVGMRTLAGVELLHPAPDAAASLDHRDLVAHDDLAWHVEHMFGMVEERDGVVVAAEQEDTPTERCEPRQRRPVTVRVVPRLRLEHVSSVWSAADETDDVVVRDRARPRPQQLDERPVLALRTGRARVERRQRPSQLRLDVSRKRARAHLVVVFGTARVHEQRTGRPDRIREREVDLIGPARDRTHRPDRRMHHHQVACVYPHRHRVTCQRLA